jgi:hypothetical protein
MCRRTLDGVSIHDVLTSREARSDPTASRARIRGEPPLHGWALSGAAAPAEGVCRGAVPAPEAKAPLGGWTLSGARGPKAE